MSILAARIDNRLLHGIVATQWMSEYRPQRLMVIDDEYAEDPNKKAAMRMAKPAGAALSIITRATAYANFEAGKYDGHTVFVIVRDPLIVRHLQEMGQHVPVLVIGGTTTPEAGVPARAANRRAFILESEVDLYRAIESAGTNVISQYVPSDDVVPLEQILK